MAGASGPTEQPDHRRPTAAAAPALGPILLLTFLGSLGTGAITNGVFFIAREQYAFSDEQNWRLALLASAAYIASALGIGPLIRRINARTALTSRAALAWLSCIMALLCLLPLLWRDPLALWLFVPLYQLPAGALWPIVESFVSGGRRGRDLRRAMGLFNLAWAGAVALAFWLMAPFMEARPLWVIAGLAGLHAVSLPIIALLRPEAGRHADPAAGQPAHDHRQYRRLLACFRLALIMSYVLISALSPALPHRTAEVGIPIELRTPAASTWLTIRVAVFALLMFWQGWHGRRRTLIWSIACLAAGFSLAMIAPTQLLLLGGLALLGVGAGATYTAAIYYAMAEGEAQIDAGGKHEALIGSGYLAGPAFSLLAARAAAGGLIEPGNVHAGAVITVGAAGLLLILWIVVIARRG